MIDRILTSLDVETKRASYTNSGRVKLPAFEKSLKCQLQLSSKDSQQVKDSK